MITQEINSILEESFGKGFKNYEYHVGSSITDGLEEPSDKLDTIAKDYCFGLFYKIPGSFRKNSNGKIDGSVVFVQNPKYIKEFLKYVDLYKQKTGKNVELIFRQKTGNELIFSTKDSF